jgi:hypothetical protein
MLACAETPTVECHERVGILLCADGRRDEMRVVLQRLAERDGAMARRAEARIHAACGEREASHEAWRAALQLAADDLELALEGAAAVSDVDRALASFVLRSQVQHHFDDAKALVRLARALADCGDDEGEADALGRAWALAPTDPNIGIAWTMVLVRAGQCSFADSTWREVSPLVERAGTRARVQAHLRTCRPAIDPLPSRPPREIHDLQAGL